MELTAKDKAKIKLLKAEFGKLTGIDPSGPEGRAFLEFIHNMKDDELKLMSVSDIKFVSPLAKNELKRRGIKESFPMSGAYAVKWKTKMIKKTADSKSRSKYDENEEEQKQKSQKSWQNKYVKRKVKEDVRLDEISAGMKMRYVRAAEQDVAVNRIASNQALVKTGVSQNATVVKKAYKLHNKLEKKNLNRLIKVDNVARQLTKESESHQVVAVTRAGEKFRSGVMDKKKADSLHWKMAKKNKYKSINVMKNEATLGDSKGLRTYSAEFKKSRGKTLSKVELDDIEDFMSAAGEMEKGDLKLLGAMLQHMDTDPRDKILTYVDKKYWKALGFDDLHARTTQNFDLKNKQPTVSNYTKNKKFKSKEDYMKSLKKEGVDYDSGWHKSKGDVTDKSGAKHTGMSKARDLARKARDLEGGSKYPFKGAHKIKDNENPVKLANHLARLGLRKVTKEERDLSEISQPTKDRYVQKAIDDHGHQNYARRSTTPGSAEHETYKRKERNRKKGIVRAMPESTELSEISKDAKSEYRDRASFDYDLLKFYVDNNDSRKDQFKKDIKKRQKGIVRSLGLKAKGMEEDVQLDEISDTKMGQYLIKATKQKSDIRKKAVSQGKISSLHRNKKYWNRSAGIARASSRMESVVPVMEVRHPLNGHPYHSRSDDQLDYIIKDAGEAKRAMSGGHNPAAENKYADQVNDVATVKHMRSKFKNGKTPDWYSRKYGHVLRNNESVEHLDELSNKLLKRYVKKSADSANKSERQVNKWFGRDDEKFSKANAKVKKRDKNIRLANRKMAEETVNELSTGLLKRYSRKSLKDQESSERDYDTYTKRADDYKYTGVGLTRKGAKQIAARADKKADKRFLGRELATSKIKRNRD